MDTLDMTETIKTLPSFDTGRFTLRPLRRSDQGMIEHYTADGRVAKNTSSIPHPLPPGCTEAFVTGAMTGRRGDVVWAMDGTQSEGPEVMGVIALKPMDRGQSEIGYWVAPAFWNSGLASEAVAALVAANPLGDKTLFAQVFQDNAPSARVLTNCGFSYLGDAETYSVARGATVPTWTYSRKL